MDETKSTSIDSSKSQEKLSEADSRLQIENEGEKTQKRPNSPTAAETPPEKKQKVKKGKEKKKVKSRNKKIDLDKQCGVINSHNNKPCTRSLTCKSHSLTLKRSVTGRSQPFDTLLSRYQKKSIVRSQGENNEPNNNNDNNKQDDVKEKVDVEQNIDISSSAP
ncbi:SCA7-domain-containing protein [Rhizophagus irregularis]|uniref:SCA7-domain-containing protein n=1 Tax=Rhizophagus irregularis TaxID=588596 RepID=A0A2N1NZD3_9GLOM|nr:SCA7-domain-containing protein [Rhizophagus irregularis]